jgi:outer membrane cobalamin receptor
MPLMEWITSPLLNFVLGNLMISEIDVQSVELLPGASSALYGANAFNGILFMNSKKPIHKSGNYCLCKIWSDKPGSNDYVDYGIRMAHVQSQISS